VRRPPKHAAAGKKESVPFPPNIVTIGAMKIGE
jgi:hypothetical protein